MYIYLTLCILQSYRYFKTISLHAESSKCTYHNMYHHPNRNVYVRNLKRQSPFCALRFCSFGDLERMCLCVENVIVQANEIRWRENEIEVLESLCKPEALWRKGVSKSCHSNMKRKQCRDLSRDVCRCLPPSRPISSSDPAER